MEGCLLSLKCGKWATCLLKICAYHNLPSPLSHEKFPVGTGSNPVFLVSGYVVKIFVEGGRGYSMHSLGTELEFKTILDKVKSPLMDHVPEIVASGFVVGDHSDFKIFAWDGREVPDMIANTIPMIGGNVSHGFPFGIWSKKKFQLENLGVNSFIRIWPYIVSRRCRGDILANVRDQLSENEAFHLASFLGEQLRHLHLLPLPNIQVNENHIDMGRTMQSDEVGCNNWSANAALMETGCKDFDTLQGWKLVMATLDRRKANVKKILAQWGDPIPAFLMDKVEEYLPHDLSVLFHVKKGDDGSFIYTRSPTWIHSDIMDDNIHMKQCCPSESADTHLGMNAIFEEKLWKWCPSHILDFSDLSIGDPLADLIPIHLDVFRGETCLLNRLLESYKLPLFTNSSKDDGEENAKNFAKPSYKAISSSLQVLCILHEENVLGAIFSLWKELRTAKSWVEVEETVWGELNSYTSE
ncbi:hypothetical protein HPP92_011193 [Vanilla planifolia]|uniref:Uncharacterized protein n=1 Tax=Vanilla planifolia TaxID=51239 RepID=A0A835QV88_VANPL|nr:hypothetical protein HPP92_011193 [Vanilla planifolia]